jgi:excisionase family DNA binding protein
MTRRPRSVRKRVRRSHDRSTHGEQQRTDERLGDVRFLTVAEVASLMRVSKMTVYRLVHSNDLTAVRVGRSFRVPEHAVHAYLRGAFRETA